MYESYALLRPIVIFAATIGIRADKFIHWDVIENMTLITTKHFSEDKSLFSELEQHFEQRPTELHYYILLKAISALYLKFQSAAWISMAITGLVAYYYNLHFVGFVASFGTITELTLFQMYFHGGCFQSGFPDINLSVLDSLNLMTPAVVHGWMWAYLFVSILWMISSITLVTNVRHTYIKWANIFLYIWIILTFGLSVMDLAFGILFSLDYSDLMFLAHQTPINVAPPNTSEFVLISAQTASGAMLTIAFRGFVLWLINVGLAIYLFAMTFNIFDYNKIQPVESVGATNGEFVVDERNHPMNAFGNKNQPNLWIAPMVLDDQRQSGIALYEERKRHYDNQPLPHQRPTQPNSTFYPPQQTQGLNGNDRVEMRRANAQLVRQQLARELSVRNSRSIGQNEANVTAAGYSSYMPRASPYEASPLRVTTKQTRY